MKVGTDGVLLGAWANVEEAGAILDIGTGTGLIALMCAQRSRAKITGIEIDTDTSFEADRNRLLSPWKERIAIVNDSFQHYASITKNKYHVIVSNPPFFRNSLRSPVRRRSLARHDDMFNIESFFHHSCSVLESDGIISMIIPAEDIEFISQAAYFHEIAPVRMTFVRPCTGKKSSRCLVEYSGKALEECLTGEITIRDTGNNYTAEYKKLTGNFYLNF